MMVSCEAALRCAASLCQSRKRTKLTERYRMVSHRARSVLNNCTQTTIKNTQIKERNEKQALPTKLAFCLSACPFVVRPTDLPRLVILHELVRFLADVHDSFETVFDADVFEVVDVLGFEGRQLLEEHLVLRQQTRGRNHVAALGVQERQRAIDEVAQVVEQL